MYAGIRSKDGLKVAIKHVAKAKIKEWGHVSTFPLQSLIALHDHRADVEVKVEESTVVTVICFVLYLYYVLCKHPDTCHVNLTFFSTTWN